MNADKISKGWLKRPVEARNNDSRRGERHVGKGSGLLLLLRSLPYHASRNRHFRYIPTEVAAKHGLLVKEGGRFEIRLDPRESSCNAVFGLASVANVHLQKSRSLAGTVPSEARSVLLPAVFDHRLVRSRSSGYFSFMIPMNVVCGHGQDSDSSSLYKVGS
ncbi:hypothetical protein Peur_020333 [Populus x canadensis]